MKTDIVYGLHAVGSLLKNRKEDILELFVLRGRHDKRLHNLLQRSKGIQQTFKNRNALNEIAHSEQHQGIVASPRRFRRRKNDGNESPGMRTTASPISRSPARVGNRA